MPRRPPKFFPKGYAKILPGIMMISNIRENGEPIGALPDGEMMFHHDMIHSEMPDKATLLYSVEIPSTGGNTLFASGYAAYDTLDPAVRNKLEGRIAIHHYNYGSVQKGDGKGTEAFGECKHPVFRTHEDTNRKAVYVNRLMTVGVEGMPQDEAEPLLNAVFDHAEKTRVRLRARLAAGRSPALGQPLLLACAHGFPLDRAPADAAHHGEGRGAAVLTIGYAPSLRARSSRLDAATSTGTFGAGSPLPGPCSFGRAMWPVRRPCFAACARSLLWAATIMQSPGAKIERFAGGRDRRAASA